LNKKVIITGSSGYLGKKLVSLLSSKGFKILKIKTNKIKELKKINEKYHSFIHLGFNLKKDCNIEKHINIVISVLNFAKSNCKNLIFASTAAVGPPKKRTILKKNNYQKAKFLCEKILKKEKSQLNILILRIFNIIGPDQKKGFLVPDLISKFSKKKFILNNYENRRDLIYVDDVCRAIHKCITQKNQKSKIIEIGSGQNFTLLEIAQKIKKIIKTNKEIITTGKKYSSPFATKAYLNKEKLNWYPKIKLENALKLILKKT
jgi:nucleoside-diphosphate-sugar epimerase